MNDIQKIEIVRVPYKSQWKESIAIIISIISIIWSYYTSKKLETLQQANLSIPWEEIKVYPYKVYPYEDKEIIEPKIKNVGRSEARDINFRVYVLPIIDIPSDKQTTIKAFDDIMGVYWSGKSRQVHKMENR